MSTAPDGLGHHCSAPFNDDPAQSKRLLELAAAYRAARAKKLSARGDEELAAAHVALLAATNALLAAALDCGEEPT